MSNPPKITPFLWFNDNALQAAKHYCRIFKNTRITSMDKLTVSLSIDGQRIILLNGGPHYRLTEAFSWSIDCKDQKEVDYYWGRLLKGGKASRCGWLTDKFGVTWQVVPRALGETLGGKDKAGAQRAFQAMMTMVKLDVKKLKKAYAGR